ncbi:serine/threonine-protein phosphatase 6 regulatory ankyrin repeat subunit A-like isoform X1 [Periplaneta americana]|uniref:serine/threonine-protein phosphatase 6 regulatory ankyrin repeat subunit A-like isoform X1 n=1 Tax=Periplaneta americana TaxID=6978 RepID=UPI0037E775B6
MTAVPAPLQLLLLQLFSLATQMVNNATQQNLVEGSVLSALNAAERQNGDLLEAVRGIGEAQNRAAAALESIAMRSSENASEKFCKETHVASSLLQNQLDTCRQELTKTQAELVDSQKCCTEKRGTSSQMKSQLDTCRQELTIIQGALGGKPKAFELALREAAKKGDEESVSMLLKIGVNASASDENLYTALHWAAWYGHVGVVTALLDGGAFIEARDKDRKTPLHWAAYGPSSKAVGPLLDRGAAVDALDKYEWTPLHWAAYSDRVEGARVLLARGASTIVRGYQSRTPLEVAKHYKKPAVAKVLSG